jgi:hypothetical protein
MFTPENPGKPAKLTWRVRARLRAGLPPRKRGGQPGNRNRLIHGRYTGYYRARRAFTQRLVRETNALIALIDLATKWKRAITNPPSAPAEGASRRRGGGPYAATPRLFDPLAQHSMSEQKRFRAGVLPRRSAPPPPPERRGNPARPIFSKTPPSHRAYFAMTGVRL